MSQKKALKEVHFICHQKSNVHNENDTTFQTGYWVMNPEHIHHGLVFALHETKKGRSYLQGEVLKVIEINEDIKESGRCMRRVNLLVRKTSIPLPWRGRGSGEKGYLWN